MTAIAVALLALLALTASPGSGRAAPQLPSMSIDDPTVVVVDEGPTEVEFTVTLTSVTEPTTTTQPATTTTQPARALPTTGSSGMPIAVVATALLIAGLVAFALGRIVSPPLLIVIVGAAGGAAVAFGASVGHAQQQPVVTVQFHTEDGTATAPEDYTATSGTIRFASGQTTATIVVPINPAIIESGETFVVVLTDPVGATISKAVGTATITVEPPPTTTTTTTTTTVAPTSTTEPTTSSTTTSTSTTSTSTTSTSTTSTSTTSTSTTSTSTTSTSTTSTTSTTTTTTTPPGADLVVVKSGPPTASFGTNITYTMDLTNLGPADATNVSLSESGFGLADLVSFTTSQGGCSSPNPIRVECALGTVAMGGSATVTVTWLAPPAGDDIGDAVTVSSDTPDPNPGNNTAVLTTFLS